MKGPDSSLSAADRQPVGIGMIIVLNGAPRSGKSSIAAAIQSMSETPWMNLGVDSVMASTPDRLLPGIGLRPGGERPDLEEFVQQSYRALFESMAAHGRNGLNVVADLGLHDWYSRPLGVWADLATRLEGIPTYLVGVRCSLDVNLERRARHPRRGAANYEIAVDGRAPEPVLRWEQSVHQPGWYDYEVDTTETAAPQCAARILDHLTSTAPSALRRFLL